MHCYMLVSDEFQVFMKTLSKQEHENSVWTILQCYRHYAILIFNIANIVNIIIHAVAILLILSHARLRATGYRW